MTKHLLAVALGALLATIIACGGGAQQTKLVNDGRPSLPPRTEIDPLDARITADLQKLNEPRPPSPPNACTASCEPQAMSGAATSATSDDASCAPAKTETCTESCNLKKSICEAAGRICTIASDLGGTDAYANEKCHSGSASCEAAKKRCCNCT